MISAGIAVVASPMSAATAAMVASLSPFNLGVIDVLMISVPAFVVATAATCLCVYWKGCELEDDPEFKRRVAAGEFQKLVIKRDDSKLEIPASVRNSVLIFALGVATVLFFGFNKELLPTWTSAAGKVSTLPIPSLIQMVMLACALFIILVCKVPSNKFADGSVFRAGLIGVVGVFGISWLTGTFFDAYSPQFIALFKTMAESTPLLFGVVLFLFSAVILSPSATVVALMPLGAAIGIDPLFLVALYPATCGDFLIPGGAQIGCCSFDRTGTTRLGTWVLNHSYMRAGLVHVITGVATGCLIYSVI